MAAPSAWSDIAVLLHEAFESVAQVRARHLALVCGERRESYAQVLQRVRALAATLRSAGVRRGDRVLILLEPGIEYAVALHAVLMAGAVMVPVHPGTKAPKLSFLAQDTRAVALLTQRSLCAIAQPAWEDADRHLRVRLPAEDWPAGDAATPAVQAGCIDQDLAALIYTSGTTGRPKGVMLTHLNMVSAWHSVQAYLGLREDDVIGLALPPTFSYGLYNLLMGLGLGATVVLERQAAFPARVAEMLQRERVTVLPGVPTLFASLLGLSHFDALDLSALRLLTNAAAALPEAHLQQLLLRLPQARLLSMYGMTECKRVSYLPHQELARRPGSVGRGMPNQEWWLVDEAGHRLAYGATGELVVRGSHVMRGYWDRQQETAERLRPGPVAGELVLHTGDLFRTDADGYLYFVARRDDIIKSRGEKVAPREVEDTIYLLPDVTACAVVGVDDPALGQAVKAFVTLRDGSALTAKDVTRHCQARLENYMVPKFVDIVAELPRTESGKIRHASLRSAAADDPAAERRTDTNEKT